MATPAKKGSKSLSNAKIRRADALDHEAAKLAGVADTLKEITEISGDASNIVGLLRDVVDDATEKVSNIAAELRAEEVDHG